MSSFSSLEERLTRVEKFLGIVPEFLMKIDPERRSISYGNGKYDMKLSAEDQQHIDSFELSDSKQFLVVVTTNGTGPPTGLDIYHLRLNEYQLSDTHYIEDDAHIEKVYFTQEGITIELDNAKVYSLIPTINAGWKLKE